MRLHTCLAVLLLISPTFASGHEFWISPADYTVGQGEEIVANLRVGQQFDGRKLAFIPANFAQFRLVQGNSDVPVKSRIGERPAMHQVAPAEGLWIIVHETTDNRLGYGDDDAQLFVDFVNHKDLKDVLAAHKARGLPDVGFVENYRRFAKSLVAVGHGAGSDRVVGLRTEIVAMSNPYEPGFDGNMRVRVLFEGAPRPGAQVELFERGADGTVRVGTFRTDDDGYARFPVVAGREYLADAVKMLPLQPDDIDNDAVWYSLWASLTFLVPE